MGLLDFLDGILSSDKTYLYSDFIRGMHNMASHEKIIEKKIEPDIIANCNTAVRIVAEKKKRFADLIRYLRLFSSTRSEAWKGKIHELSEWFKGIEDEYESSKLDIGREKDIYHRIFELEKNDSEIIMKFLHKLKKLENFSFSEPLLKEIAKSGLFQQLTLQESSDQELISRVLELNELLRQELNYIRSMDSRDIPNLIKGANSYDKNLLRQEELLNEILKIEERKRQLVSNILRLVQQKLLTAGAYGSVCHLPYMDITLEMSSELDRRLAKDSFFSSISNKGELVKVLGRVTDNNFLITSIENFEAAKQTKRLKVRNFALSTGLLTDIHLRMNDLHHLIAYFAFLTYPKNTSSNVWDILEENRPIHSKHDFTINYLVVAYRMSKNFDYKGVAKELEVAVKEEAR